MTNSLLFDLFGTVVHFAPRVPTVEIGGEKWRTTMGWLSDAVRETLPDISFDAFTKALMSVTAEMTRQRAPEYLELPSRQRFLRALQQLPQPIPNIEAAAERLSLVHMDHLASQTMLPAGHQETLSDLGSRYRLALISNFDHGATARRVLRDHGVDHFFELILISEEFGRRKPHPAIFISVLEKLGVAPSEAMYIGDSWDDDVVGAHNAGIPSVWINTGLAPDMAGDAAPLHIVDSFTRLPELL